MVISIAIFPFNREMEETARKGLEKNLDWGKSQAGHIKSFLAQPRDGTNRYLVYSEWEKEEDFDAVRRILMKRSMKELEEFMEWMDGEPVYGSFQKIS